MLPSLFTWQESTLEDFPFPFDKIQSILKRHQGIKIPHLFNMIWQQNSAYAYAKLMGIFVEKTDDRWQSKLTQSQQVSSKQAQPRLPKLTQQSFDRKHSKPPGWQEFSSLAHVKAHEGFSGSSFPLRSLPKGQFCLVFRTVTEQGRSCSRVPGEMLQEWPTDWYF